MAVEAVIFDWSGTLTPWHMVDHEALWVRCAPNISTRHQLPRSQLLATYFAAWEPRTFTDLEVPGRLRDPRAREIKVGVLSNTLWPRARHEQIFARDGVLDLIDGAVY